MIEGEALSFDDVLLKPQRSNVGSRSNVDISTKIVGLKLDIPIIAANMAFCERSMLIGMAKLGGLGILHRMMPIEDRLKILKDCRRTYPEGKFGASVGVSDEDFNNAIKLFDNGADLILIDVAHAHQDKVINFAKKWKKGAGYIIPTIIGNIATGDAVDDFYMALEELPMKPYPNWALKVGVGGGAACSTRVNTGCGIPTFQSIMDVEDAGGEFQIISDGGTKNSGDIVKSLAAGADAVMLGKLLAGSDEAAGKDRGILKEYAGNASEVGKRMSGGPTSYIEGEVVTVTRTGPLKNTINKLCDGIRSGFSYCGASNLTQLQAKARFIKISNSGYREGLPHGLL